MIFNAKVAVICLVEANDAHEAIAKVARQLNKDQTWWTVSENDEDHDAFESDEQDLPSNVHVLR